MTDLYQELILDHFKHPRNFGPVGDDELLADVDNPNCGDRFRLTLRIEEGRIGDVRFEGKGCAISMAAFSLMSEQLRGMPAGDAAGLLGDYETFMQGRQEVAKERIGGLVALESVRKFPLRVKCATLCVKAVRQALERVSNDWKKP